MEQGVKVRGSRQSLLRRTAAGLLALASASLFVNCGVPAYASLVGRDVPVEVRRMGESCGDPVGAPPVFGVWGRCLATAQTGGNVMVGPAFRDGYQGERSVRASEVAGVVFVTLSDGWQAIGFLSPLGMAAAWRLWRRKPDRRTG